MATREIKDAGIGAVKLTPKEVEGIRRGGVLDIEHKQKLTTAEVLVLARFVETWQYKSEDYEKRKGPSFLGKVMVSGVEVNIEVRYHNPTTSYGGSDNSYVSIEASTNYGYLSQDRSEGSGEARKLFNELSSQYSALTNEVRKDRPDNSHLKINQLNSVRAFLDAKRQD